MTRHTNAAFFDFLLGGLENLHGHRLPPQRPFQLANALLHHPQPTDRHHILIGRDRPLPALREQELPPVQQRAGHIQLPAELRDRRLAPHHAVDLVALKLGRKDPPPIRFPLNLHLRDPLLDSGC